MACTMLTAQAQFNGGTGTADDPYLIRRPAQLANLSTILNQEGVVVKLQSDIDLTGYLEDEEFANEGWAPIGTSTEPFKGTVIGNGKKIKGLNINRPSESYVGLFGYLDGADISDLTIECTAITGSSYLGTLAGNAKNCTLNNCHVSVENEISSADGMSVGGVIGIASNCNITNCDFEGTVSGSDSGVTGGLIGTSNSVTMTSVSLKGQVTGVSYVGGVIGKSEGTNLLSGISYDGNITGQTTVGGIAAYLAGGSSTFASCIFKGTVTASGDYAGGIVGRSMDASITGMENCCCFGDVIGNSYVGGLIGAVTPSQSTVPTLNYYSIRVVRTGSGGTYTQGFCSDAIVEGTPVSYPVKNNVVSGNFTGNEHVGGIIGYDMASVAYPSTSNWTETDGYSTSYAKSWSVLKNGNVYGSYSGTRTVRITWYRYSRTPSSLSITDNYCVGRLTGTRNVGGLLGSKAGGEVLRNYACVAISGEDNVGGLVGQFAIGSTDVAAFKATIASNVAANSVIKTQSSEFGRIYGTSDSNYSYVTVGELGSNTANRSLETTQVIKNGIFQVVNDDLKNGEGMSTLETLSNNTYLSLGWDFDSDWSQLDGNSYPYKKYQAAPPSVETEFMSMATAVEGQSANGGTVYLAYNGQEPIAIECEGDSWAVTTEPLQGGTTATIYAEADGLVPSYPVTQIVRPQGAGTEEDPYRLYTAYDLQGVYKSGYYKLMNNIDLASWITANSPTEGWKPIGQNGIEAIYFDGNNYGIKGLWSSATETNNGLFACLAEGSSVSNLSVNVATGKKLQGGIIAGILTGYAANTTFDNCMVNGSVEASDYAGGLVGYAEGGSILQCCSKGSVTATGSEGYAGGLAAWCSTPVSNSYSSANVDAAECVAGLVGYSSSTIDKCYAQGNVTGANYGAGLVAQLSGESAAITNSVALNGTITMTDEYASASRVLNSNINGCPDPDDSNLALKTTQLTLNGKTEKIYDDEWEGQGKTLDELLRAATYESLGWDFTSTWGIMENETPPYLFYEIKQGDVNFDGQVDMTDAVCIVYYYLGELPGIFIEKTADMNGDGQIDLTDAIIIVYQYLGEGGNDAGARSLLREITENEPQ